MDGENKGRGLEKLPKPLTAKQKLTEMQEKMETIKQVTSYFNAERYTYLFICGFAGILVLANAVMMLINHQTDAATLTLLFGSGGLIAYSAGRLLHMWNKVIDVIFEQSDVKGGINNASH